MSLRMSRSWCIRLSRSVTEVFSPLIFGPISATRAETRVVAWWMTRGVAAPRVKTSSAA